MTQRAWDLSKDPITPAQVTWDPMLNFSMVYMIAPISLDERDK